MQSIIAQLNGLTVAAISSAAPNESATAAAPWWVAAIPLFLTAITLLVTIWLAFRGWVVAHKDAAARDRANKQRDVRTQYLIETFRALADAFGRPPSDETRRIQESSVTDVQLFGTPDQVKLLQDYAKDLAAGKDPDLDEFLKSLRDDLRNELQLEEVAGGIGRLRAKRVSQLQHHSGPE